MKRTIRITALLLTAVITTATRAQVNDKGTFHAAIGVAFGGHGTEYETTVRLGGLSFTDTEADGAATLTVPIEFDYGLAKIFSLGVYIEPGAYLDSNATETNSLILAGIQPRFYLVNNENFALMASLQFGTSGLRIERDEDNIQSSARYAGGHFGLGAGAAFQFTDHFGLQLHLRYVGTSMPLRKYEIEGDEVSLDDFEAVLRTRGVAFQVSAAFRF